MTDQTRQSPLRDAHKDIESVHELPDTPQSRAPAYRLAFTDNDFLCRDELRAVRLQLELLKPQMVLDERGIETTVVLFGGARIPEPGKKARSKGMSDLSHFYAEAREFARLMTRQSLESYGKRDVICTGGGPGVMEAGNRGAQDAGGSSIGLNIVLPHEQAPNEYVTPDLCFNFHYFAIRKMHFLMRARAVCVFPGGFGTMDETFEALTLIQTGRMQKIPFLLFGRAFWEKVINFEALCEAGTISPEDLSLFKFVETAAEAMEAIRTWDGAGETRNNIPGRDA
ncbi:TIGR00730 family Rossman fold protein [Pseudooceanicola sediminis]|uniref:Cytokinin riboside 5'-monophosphate phosphoribohydrolase n=1 Tax=Pseudooceanicola sediminis TaxID=2211117 RepID=A0A399J3D5_9RHOB|nr:TIGR00730 family Rossman fold protein [Pseudooceanicola sediminis]KAA2313443.1 TIGR00730 family Rossman fold protein [Puniceibacterium sp. HSS470]RII38422.1 TIGR00730 family Rossman fold protein [Pseudooceanicola sediminis]